MEFMDRTTDTADEAIGESGNDAAANPISSKPAREKRKGRCKLQPVPPVDVSTLAGWRRTLFYIEQVCCILTVVSALVFMFFVALDVSGYGRVDVFYYLSSLMKGMDFGFSMLYLYDALFYLIVFLGFLFAVLVTGVIAIIRSARALAGKKCGKGAEGMMISSALCFLTYAMYYYSQTNDRASLALETCLGIFCTLLLMLISLGARIALRDPQEMEKNLTQMILDGVMLVMLVASIIMATCPIENGNSKVKMSVLGFLYNNVEDDLEFADLIELTLLIGAMLLITAAAHDLMRCELSESRVPIVYMIVAVCLSIPLYVFLLCVISFAYIPWQIHVVILFILISAIILVVRGHLQRKAEKQK